MHDLNVMVKRNEDQVRREYQDALDRNDLETAGAIARANPDLFKRYAR